MLECKLENVKTDVDYDELIFFESSLTHELHRMTESDFIEKYKEIDNWTHNEDERALLSAILNYVGYTVEYTPKYFILDYLDYDDFIDEEGNFTEETLKTAYDESIDAFRKCGLLYKEFGGFADGTYYQQSNRIIIENN